ncbi:uncharacterized protein BXZ73DRAFT_19110, partial [Epithele typhae]|uniref:uncharacterized protein n=1 Tax=Epithele typhae TaxID=378194 RepID=UPI0020082A9A
LSPGRIERLTLMWHQYGGVLLILDKPFQGHPAMLCNEVGLGKTIQAVLVMCHIDYSSNYYVKHGKWPGQFGGESDPRKYKLSPFQERVHVVVVPTGLTAQWRSELDRLLKPQDVTVLPYEG